MFTKLFWKDAIERAVATFVQTFIAVASVVVAAGHGLEHIDWVPVISAGTLAALLSLAKSIYALKFTDGNSASLIVTNVKEK